MRRKSSTRLGVHALEGREVPACTVALGGPDTLVITGDNANDAVVIRDNGAGTIWGVTTGGVPFSFSGIKNINVATGGGNDRVVYYLMRDMLEGEQRVLNVWLERGNDSFTANLYDPTQNFVGRDLRKSSSLIMGIFGAEGNDHLLVNAQRDVDVGAGARLKMVMHGNDGDDMIRAYYRGENDGGVSFREFAGQAGADIIRGHLKEDAGSTGASAGIVLGGDGNDQLALWLDTINVPIQGLIDGGAGIDTEVHSPNVTVLNCP